MFVPVPSLLQTVRPFLLVGVYRTDKVGRNPQLFGWRRTGVVTRPGIYK